MISLYRMAVDGRNCAYRDLYQCNLFVDRIIENLKVKEISRMSIDITSPMGAEHPGVSISVIFLESGMSLHTWPEHFYVSLDIFSCQPFDKEIVETLFARFFETKVYEIIL